MSRGARAYGRGDSSQGRPAARRGGAYPALIAGGALGVLVSAALHGTGGRLPALAFLAVLAVAARNWRPAGLGRRWAAAAGVAALAEGALHLCTGGRAGGGAWGDIAAGSGGAGPGRPRPAGLAASALFYGLLVTWRRSLWNLAALTPGGTQARTHAGASPRAPWPPAAEACYEAAILLSLLATGSPLRWRLLEISGRLLLAEWRRARAAVHPPDYLAEEARPSWDL
jgi:hypothetical protein